MTFHQNIKWEFLVYMGSTDTPNFGPNCVVRVGDSHSGPLYAIDVRFSQHEINLAYLHFPVAERVLGKPDFIHEYFMEKLKLMQLQIESKEQK